MWKFRNSTNALTTKKKKTLKINCTNNLYYFHEKVSPGNLLRRVHYPCALLFGENRKGQHDIPGICVQCNWQISASLRPPFAAHGCTDGLRCPTEDDTRLNQ